MPPFGSLPGLFGEIARQMVGEFKRDYEPGPQQPLSAHDVKTERLDRDAFGRVFPEIKLAVAEQILRSIATEQIGANAGVKALAASYFEAVK
jgi:hypothetical protein